MALASKIDPRWAAQQLRDWLHARMPLAAAMDVSNVVIPSGSGMSNETVIFTASWRDADGTGRSEGLVARVQPRGDGLFPSYDVELEFRLMRALAEQTGIPVPPVLWCEKDVSVLGGPFLVMRRVHGRIPADDPPFCATGWVTELNPASVARMADNGLRVLADLHSVDWSNLEIPTLPQGIDSQVAYWRRFYDWAAQDAAFPTIEAAFRWIDANRPDDNASLVLSWGDARIGNMIFTDDLDVAAVLDWEAGMVCTAPREFDLGWWVFSNRFSSEPLGLSLPAGFPTPRATVVRYEQLTGHRVRNLHFYETFAALRAAILMVRAAGMLIKAGLVPPDSAMAINNPASQLLAAAIGVAAHEGETTSFTGNRGGLSPAANEGGAR